MKSQLDLHMKYRESIIEEYPEKEYEEFGVQKIKEEIEDKE